MCIVNSFQKHRREPGKSAVAYLEELRMALGERISPQYKVYLDTNYWLMLSDVRLGRRDDALISELLDLLEDAAASGILICPISSEVFLEILKQSDPISLGSSAELIDMLSDGVSVLAPKERERMELLYFIRKNSSGEESVHSQEMMVWTRLPYVLGMVIPCDTCFSPEDELAIRKSFVDIMWNLSLTEMIETVGLEALRQMPKMPDISGDLNTGKFTHSTENSSFDEVFLSEIAGILDEHMADFREMFVYLEGNTTGNIPTNSEALYRDMALRFANVIYHGFRLKRITTEPPSLRIPAAIHAAIRCDTHRKYKRTDAHDFRHAEAALPYFDVFLTERSLCHLLTRSDLTLDQIYKCTVIADPLKAVEEVKKALG